jgi:hypothetical protein
MGKMPAHDATAIDQRASDASWNDSKDWLDPGLARPDVRDADGGVPQRAAVPLRSERRSCRREKDHEELEGSARGGDRLRHGNQLLRTGDDLTSKPTPPGRGVA